MNRANDEHIKCLRGLAKNQEKAMESCMRLLPDFTDDYLDCLDIQRDRLQDVRQREQL
jgi:hypothetical protein